MRIVSLIASATEIVCALGMRDHLVGRSHECDYPASVKELPQCSRPKFPDGTSGEIDKSVRALVEKGLSVYEVDADLLASLKPDVIVTQDQCEVCAVSLADVESALCQVVGLQTRVVSLKPFSLEDVLEDIQRVADALEISARGVELVAELRERIAGLRVQSLVPEEIALLEWLEPLMASGYWAPQLTELAGGQDPLGASKAHAPWIDFEQLRKADPAAILAMPCGFDLERAAREMRAIVAANPAWRELRAVKEDRVYAADGNAYFNRPGPRLVESLAILTQVLWSGAHSGEGWLRLDF